jgi:P-type Cu+ transporter
LNTGDGSLDVKQLAQREVDKYFWNFLFCLVLYVPLGLLIWMFPYIKSTQPLLTVGQFWRGNTVYVLLCLIFATIVQFIMGQPFYLSAYKSLKHGNANMDVLIVVSTTCAWLYGVILFFVGYAETYTMEGHNRALSSEEMLKHYRHEIHANVHNFETSAILILIVLLGKYIESYSKLKTLDKISVLASLKVSKANLLAEQDVKLVSLNSAFTEIAVELLAIDDFIVVQPGGAVPTDGQVVLGSGICNESMLTGEARPVTKEIGMSVFGGTILTKGSIVVRVTKLAEDATFN